MWSDSSDSGDSWDRWAFKQWGKTWVRCTTYTIALGLVFTGGYYGYQLHQGSTENQVVNFNEEP